MKKLLIVLAVAFPLFLSAQVELYGTLGGTIYGSRAGAGVGPMHQVGVLRLDTICFGASAGYAAWHFNQQFPQTRSFARVEAGYEVTDRIIFMIGVDVFASRSQGYVQVCIGPRIIYKPFEGRHWSGLITLNGGLGGISYLGSSFGLSYKISKNRE